MPATKVDTVPHSVAGAGNNRLLTARGSATGLPRMFATDVDSNIPLQARQ